MRSINRWHQCHAASTISKTCKLIRRGVAILRLRLRESPTAIPFGVRPAVRGCRKVFERNTDVASSRVTPKEKGRSTRIDQRSFAVPTARMRCNPVERGERAIPVEPTPAVFAAPSAEGVLPVSERSGRPRVLLRKRDPSQHVGDAAGRQVGIPRVRPSQRSR